MGSCRGWATGKVRRHEAPFEHNWNHSSQGFHPMLPQPWCCHLYFASSQTKALPLSLLVIRDKVSHFPKLVIAVKSSHLHSRGSSPPSTPSPCPSFTFLDSTNAQDSADVSSAVSRRPAIFNCPLQHPPWAQPPTWSNFSGPLPTSVPTTSKALRPIDLSLKKKKVIGGYLLYNIVLVSAIHQHESAIGIHMSPPSWTSLLPPTPAHPSRLSRSTGFELPVSHREFPLAIYFTYGNV